MTEAGPLDLISEDEEGSGREEDIRLPGVRKGVGHTCLHVQYWSQPIGHTCYMYSIGYLCAALLDD